MPAYIIEFLSDRRPQSRRFTLDDDRPLRPQIDQVLAELERVGVVLQGTASDELAVYWMSRELDLARSPAALGLTSDRPIELRMQRRRPSVTPAPAAPERPATRFTPKAIYASAAWGLVAGAIAWALSTLVEDRTGWLASDARLDVLAGALWAGWVALLVAWSDARRGDRPAAGGATLALACAVLLAVGWMAVMGSLPEPATLMLARLARLAAWIGLTMAAGLGVWVAGRAVAAVTGGIWRVLAGAVVAGIVAAALAALPGAVVLWGALASVVAGAGVGAALAAASTREATVVLELEARADRPVGIVSLREWALRDGASASVRDVASGAGGGVVQVSCVRGRCLVHEPDAAGAARELRNEDRLIVGRSRYRFRRRGVGVARA